MSGTVPPVVFVAVMLVMVAVNETTLAAGASVPTTKADPEVLVAPLVEFMELVQPASAKAAAARTGITKVRSFQLEVSNINPFAFRCRSLCARVREMPVCTEFGRSNPFSS